MKESVVENCLGMCDHDSIVFHKLIACLSCAFIGSFSTDNDGSDGEDENLGTTGIRGTGIYVKDGLCSIGTIIEHTNHEDQVWIQITPNKQDKLLCGCIYI